MAWVVNVRLVPIAFEAEIEVWALNAFVPPVTNSLIITTLSVVWRVI
jgi:hypothetical protein